MYWQSILQQQHKIGESLGFQLETFQTSILFVHAVCHLLTNQPDFQQYTSAVLVNFTGILSHFNNDKALQDETDGNKLKLRKVKRLCVRRSCQTELEGVMQGMRCFVSAGGDNALECMSHRILPWAMHLLPHRLTCHKDALSQSQHEPFQGTQNQSALKGRCL